MQKRLFLGVADNNQYSVAVVGDSTGRIMATSVGESVNHQFYGISLARENLKSLVTNVLGDGNNQLLERVCFTYKWDPVIDDLEAGKIIQGVVETREIQLEKFSRSCTLGMNTKRDRMFLVGSESSYVIFEDKRGNSFHIADDSEIVSIKKHLESKLRLGFYFFGEPNLYHVSDIQQLDDLISTIDELAKKGNLLALELIHEIAHGLISLIIRMSRQFQSYNPVIALYGRMFFRSSLIYERVYYLINLLYPRAQILEGTLIPAKGAYLSLVNRKSCLKPELVPRLS